MGSSTKKTTSDNTPWAPAQPFVLDSFGALQNANNRSQANLNVAQPYIDSAIQRIGANITAPPSYNATARRELERTINGDYVNSNPHTGGIADLIAAKTGAQYNSTFGAAGRSRGGMAALLSGQGVGDALRSFYSDTYNNERQLQQQAIMAAPGFNQDEYTAINNFMPVAQASTLLPLQGATAYSGGVANAAAPYVRNVTTERTTPSLLSQIASGVGIVSQGLGAALGGGGMAGMMGGGGKSIGNGGGLKAFLG